MANSKTWKFTGCKWSSVPTYYDFDKKHEYPNFEVVAEQKFKINFNRPCSLAEAELYFLMKHPEWAIGFNCSNDNGDFSCNCVKGYWFQCGETPTDAEIIEKMIESAKTHIENDKAIAEGKKKWVEDPYTGDYILVDA